MTPEGPMTEKRCLCGVCSAGCWIVASLDARGRLVSVRPETGTPMGHLCKLGEHAPEIVYAPHRVLHPLRRKGKKGSLDFERVSWDEAFEEIVQRLEALKEAHGPEAAAVYTGVGSFERSLCDVFQPRGVAVSSASSVLFPFGSPNTMGVGALCYVAYGMIAPHVTTGKMLVDLFNDIEHAELVVVWGTNPATDLPPVDLGRILDARRRGAEVVVVDPRRTETARLADADWIPIRPGTDGALALGLSHVLIEEELFDEAFARDWTRGFDDFARYAGHFRPEEVERLTTVPAGTVRDLARRLARARGASQLMYTGLEYSPSGVQAIRAALTAWALAGQLDVPGGRCFRMNGNDFPLNREGHVANPGGNVRIGRDRFPVYVHYRDEANAIGLPDAVLEGRPYPVRALIVQGASITTSWPDPARWKETLASLDLLVCIDRQLTADAAFADFVLPAATAFEIDSYMVYGPVFRLREKVIEPLGEARNDFFIMAELARRLGYGDRYPQSAEALLRHVLAGSGFTLEAVREAGGTVAIPAKMMAYRKWEKGLLRPDGKPGFPTPSGKFEIASTVLEEFGYDPLPVFSEPAEGPTASPGLLERYPLVFNSGARTRNAFHTQHRGVPALAREQPEPVVTLNDADARARGIEEGDLVRIATPRASITMRARVTPDIAKGCIEANHAGGSPVGPEAWRLRNVNALTDLEQFDPISGFPVYKALLCEVSKADGKAPAALVLPEEMKAGAFEDRPAGPAKEIYLDHNATTPLAPDVREAMEAALETYGNPSSIHAPGREASKVLDAARRALAQVLNCTARRIVFTGSGSEAANLALKGAALARPAGKNRLITTAVEHPAVLNASRRLERHGTRLTVLPVDGTGRVDPDDLRKALGEDVFLVSVMAANNETGSLQPVSALAEIAREAGALFHTDAVQALGKIPLDVASLGADLVSVSAHKIYGPKGAGALYVRRGVEIEPLVDGGGHEGGLRGGTENLVGIAGFGAAAARVPSLLADRKRIGALRDRLQAGIAEAVPGATLNGPSLERLSNTLNVSLPGFRGESVVLEMSRRGVYLSAGSACRSSHAGPSGALLALGLSREAAHGALRFSLGAGTTEEDVDRTLEAFRETIETSRRVVHFFPCR